MAIQEAPFTSAHLALCRIAQLKTTWSYFSQQKIENKQGLPTIHRGIAMGVAEVADTTT